MIILYVISLAFSFSLGWVCAACMYSRPLDEGWVSEDTLPPVEDEQ